MKRSDLGHSATLITKQMGPNSGSANHNTQHNYESGESSDFNLSRQRVWSRAHPFKQIIGDPEKDVQT